MEAEGKALVGRYVFVGGEVRGPGRIAWTNGMTLNDAIALALGCTSYADLRHIEVVKSETNKVFVDRSSGADAKSPNPSLSAGDTVYVPRDPNQVSAALSAEQANALGRTGAPTSGPLRGEEIAEAEDSLDKYKQKNVRPEPEKPPGDAGVVPPGAIHFVNIELKEFLPLYKDITGAEVDTSPMGKLPPIVVRFTNTNAITKPEAIELLNRMLYEQAGIIATNTGPNRIQFRPRGAL